MDTPGVVEPAVRLLAARRFTDLVEVEFKQDPRWAGDGSVAVAFSVRCDARSCPCTRYGKLQRHFLYRKQSIKTTWKLRLALLMLVVLIVSTTHGVWMLQLGQSLVCTEEISPSDVILVENFDPDYLVFERAAALHKAGFAARVLVPTQVSRDSERANPVSQGIAELMSRVAQLPHPTILPIRILEPVSLNAAYQIRDFLAREHLRSVIVVTHGFRSKRSLLVYHAVLDPAGIKVGCMPVFGQKTPKNWTMTWHGIEEVAEQFLKLQFYRFYVLWNRPA